MTRLRAPAKLTVSLAITGARPDGYHELRAEMVSLDLADDLVFDQAGSGLVVDAGRGTRAEGLAADSTNLVTRALAAVGREASVHLTKRIPLGAGLGGGSADAGAVLRWAGCDDPELAAGLGADVPFCVAGGRALVEGIGERVTPLAFEAASFILCLPPFGVETARVYAAWDEAPDHQPPNALTAAALRVEPRLARWRDALGDLTGRTPVLAGSGSTWFVPGQGAAAAGPWLEAGGERARLLEVAAVPPGWDGT